MCMSLFCQFYNFFEVSTLLHLDLIRWRLHICPSHSQLLCTLQLLPNCCTPKSIINVIVRYTSTEMHLFISIHSTKHIKHTKNLNTYVMLFTHGIYSSMDFTVLVLTNFVQLLLYISFEPSMLVISRTFLYHKVQVNMNIVQLFLMPRITIPSA